MLQVALVLQHFMCHLHYYGRIYDWFADGPESDSLACSCVSVLWTAIPESKEPQVLFRGPKINEP